MAWCGENMTLVRLEPDAEGEARLARFGSMREDYSADEPRVQPGTTLCTPQLLAVRLDVVQVAFGRAHLAVLAAGGGVFTGGSNNDAQLGRPAACCGVPHALARVALPHAGMLGERVACGARNTLLVLRDGAGGRLVAGCGANYDGQLTTTEVLTVRSMAELDIAPLTGGSVRVPAGVSVRVAAGRSFTVVAVGGTVGTRGREAPGMPADLGDNWSTVFAPLGVSVRHLVAGAQHVLAGGAADGRLRVWGWGANTYRQLGFANEDQAVSAPTEIVFGCPQLAGEDFASMLAAWDRNSLIMVDGRVWAMGQQAYLAFEPSAAEPSFWLSPHAQVREVDPRHFDGLPVAHVGLGKKHAAFTTTCGRLYVRGFSRDSFETHEPNGLPTGVRQTRRGTTGVCRKVTLAHPKLVPPALFGGLACGVVRLGAASRVALCMGAHPRLGRASALARLDALLLQQILVLAEALLPALVRA